MILLMCPWTYSSQAAEQGSSKQNVFMLLRFCEGDWLMYIGKYSSFMESQLTFSGMNSEGFSHSSAGKEPSCNSGDPS